MEIKRKEKTLFGLFLKYVTLFCVNTILLAAGVFGLMLWAAGAGLLLPANYAEVQLSENAGEIYRAGDLLETWIPQGYGWKGIFPGRSKRRHGITMRKIIFMRNIRAFIASCLWRTEISVL